jgi:hypothetical protein
MVMGLEVDALPAKTSTAAQANAILMICLFTCDQRLALLRFTFGLDFLFGFDLAVDFFLVFGFTRSGGLAEPVSRFHSSNVWLDISPLSKSSANFLRCAWLLNGTTTPV